VPTAKKRTERKSFERRKSFDRKAQLEKISAMNAETSGDKRKEKLDGIRRKSFENEMKKEKSELMQDVEKNILEDEHAEGRIQNSQRKERKSLGANTNIGMRFTASTAEADEKAIRKDRAQQYGNSAQRAAKADDGLARLGVKVMKSFKDEINCDRCSLLFFDSIQNEMFFYSHEQRFRFSMEKGIAGYAAMSGEIVNVPDAYADPRFNKDMDKQTGFKTKNILCAPIKSRQGDGVVAVIQMLNKVSDDGLFSELDEEIIRNCAYKVSEALDLQFQTLINAQIDMERMSLDGARENKAPLVRDMDGAVAGDQKPLAEDSRMFSVTTEKDPFAEERRKRQKEYGKEVREAKVGM
jgi:hypothetical protein